MALEIGIYREDNDCTCMDVLREPCERCLTICEMLEDKEKLRAAGEIKGFD